MTVLSFCILVICVISGIHADGQFIVLHSPPSIHFEPSTKPIKEANIIEIYCASLGLSSDHTNAWDAMKLLNPFDTPEAVVEFYVEGALSLGPFIDAVMGYTLSSDTEEKEAYDYLTNRMQKENKFNSKLVNIRLSREYDMKLYKHIFGDFTDYNLPKIALKYLDYTNELDYRFIRELQALKTITAAIKTGVIKRDGFVDFYAFRFSSLHVISIFDGPQSMKTAEAKLLLNQEIRELSKAFALTYDRNMLFTVVLNEGNHRRVRRNFLPFDVSSFNFFQDFTVERRVEAPPSDDMIAIVNITFWLCLSLYFALLYIVYLMVNMDPGRDSIVYRMTSSIDRIKME